ncbi:MAG: DUF1646 family protein, partial [Elusimicrobia bacterium]|nr:DUF1646 family protein [Elusimicrobiota bacterium]
VAALALVEIISGLPLSRDRRRFVAVLACYAIGLGAVLTPVGEPLSTIATAKLAKPPYNAGFFFLAELLWPWITAGILLLGALAARAAGGGTPAEEALPDEPPDPVRTVFFRGGKVYVFVAALVLLGQGFSPIVDRYLIGLPKEFLYWVNMVSAVLDNATLAAAEVSPKMSLDQLRFLLVSLLISGGMLIPGNIPNIICANRLGLKSREWARAAVPLGAALMTLGFCSLLFL